MDSGAARAHRRRGVAVKWLAIIAVPILLGVGFALYSVGFDAVARRLKVDRSSPTFSLVAVGAFVAVLVAAAYFLDR